MDSEDERTFLRKQRERKKRVKMDFRESEIESRPGFPELRLYQLEEYQVVSREYLLHGAPKSHDSDARKRRSYYRQGIPYHAIRLCDTIKGFHKGNLDLSGRHPARYASVCKRWLAFYAELKNLLQHTTTSSKPAVCPDGSLLRDRSGSVVLEDVLVVKPDKLRKAFERKWDVVYVDPWLILELAESVIECIAHHPRPVFQKTRLLSLPPELLYKIMGFTWPREARKLGATCKVMRTISIPYVYTDRRLAMTGELEIDWKHVDSLSANEKRQYWYRKVTAARSKFVREADYLCSRPDITSQVKELIVRCWDFHQITYAYPNRDKAQLEFQFTLSRAFENVLPSMTSLTKLTLSNMAITSAVARHLVSLPQLTLLSFHSCKVTSKLRRVKTASSSVCQLALHLSYEHPDYSVWKLLRCFPTLTKLLTAGSAYALTEEEDPPAILPFATAEDGNPFLLPTLTHVQLSKLGFGEWDHLLALLREASGYGARPLHLTNLVIGAYDPLDEEFIFELIEALRSAPLEQLVLDGIRYADLPLLDRLREAFPNLTSLTLKYRTTPQDERSAPVSWPRASWEYARALAQFPHLTHFGWNYTTQTLAYPSILTKFEDGYASDDYVLDEEDHEKDILLPLFAKTCPKLQTFSVSDRSIHYFERRGKSIEFEYSWDWRGMDAVAVHDPPCLEYGHPWMK